MDWSKPSKLQPGDTVATVSSSWGGASIFPHRYEAGKRQLQEVFGVSVIEAPNCLKPADWLHNNPKARADDLHWAFSEPSIKAVISVIGGDDSIRLIPHLDFDLIRTHPKIFIGYSDTTVTHLACLKAGLSSFYGPSIMAGFAENGGMFEYTIAAVKAALFSGEPMGLFPQAEHWTNERLDWGDPTNQGTRRKLLSPLCRRVLQGQGIHQGHLIGGCAEVLEMIKGTSIWPDLTVWDGAVLLLETSEENPPPYMFTRWVRNLGVQGILSRLKGIMLARPALLPPNEDLTVYDTLLQNVVRDEFGLKDLPIFTQLDFGHTDPMFVLPLGRQVILNCESKEITLPESAVI